MKIKKLTILAAAIFQLLAARGLSEVPEIDSKDFEELVGTGKAGFDMSSYLFDKGGILPIPIVISDPAVGYGGGLVGVKFHQKPDEEAGQLVPPSVSFAGGFYTENDSWGVAGGHFHAFDNDSWRYMGVAGVASFNLAFYAFQGESGNQYLPFDFNLKGVFTLQEFSKKLGDKLHVGVRYLFLGTDTVFDTSNLPIDIPPLHLKSNTAGVGLKLAYDTRDNIMSPTKGLKAEIKPYYFSEHFGGDFEYWKVDYIFATYLSLKPFTLGLRAEGGFADESAPFYHLPYVKQRGVPSMQYQGTEAVAFEVELQYTLNDRWTLLAFAGQGVAEFDDKDFAPEQYVHSEGVGFRYLLSEELGLQAGLDLAMSDDNTVVYMTVGTSW